HNPFLFPPKKLGAAFEIPLILNGIFSRLLRVAQRLMFCRCTRYASPAVWHWPVTGLFSFSPCALLDKKAHKSVPRSNGERGGFRLFVFMFLEKEPASANTRQRPGLSFHRSPFQRRSDCAAEKLPFLDINSG
ncbi:hypothetical protein, partial [Rhizobium sp.]|uniref:hypothetical protein n=1 Tax=Rhizobium sp. TaxID=391 RepID=UPI0028A5A775